MRRDGANNTGSREVHGVTLQPKEISARAIDTHGVARLRVEHRARYPSSLQGQSESLSTENSEMPRQQDHVVSTMGELDWVTQSCGRSGSPRKNQSSEADSGRSESIPPVRSRSHRLGTADTEEKTQMVDTTEDPIVHQVGPRPSIGNNHNGCIGLGMGLPIFTRTSRSRSLEPQSSKATHQCSRTPSGPDSTAERDRLERNLGSFFDRQHSGNALFKQTGLNKIAKLTEHVREDIQVDRDQTTASNGITPTGKIEHLGRCSVSPQQCRSRMVTKTRDLQCTNRTIWNATDRSLCIGGKQKTKEVLIPDRENTTRRSKCTDNRLESMEVHIPISSTADNIDASSDSSFEGFSGTSPPNRTAMGGSTVDLRTPTVVPESLTVNREGIGATSRRVDEITSASRLEFLRTALTKDIPAHAAEDIIAGHRESTTRQYESAWKKFQRFLIASEVSEVNETIFVQFASYLFREHKLSISSISGHIAAISDPLKFAYRILPEARSLALIKSSFFLQRPPPIRSAPKWSLRKVLDLLSSPGYCENPSEEKIFRKAIFLVALATGLRVSQLAALSRSPTLTKFGTGNSSVTLAAHPKFLAKNERVNHRMQPKYVPAWIEQDCFHNKLCPVSALKQYMLKVPASKNQKLWVFPRTKQACKPSNIAKMICLVIEEADPQKAPKAHDVRGMASSIAFKRSMCMDSVQAEGQWSSCHTFVTRYLRYLDIMERDIPCIAMGSSQQIG